jgi:hypothetical protein
MLKLWIMFSTEGMTQFFVFTRWHAYIDDIFQAHKAQLPPYTVQQLSYPGITVQDLLIQAEGGRPNIINTHWQQSDLNLAKGKTTEISLDNYDCNENFCFCKGMDFVPRGDVFAR